MAWLPYYNCNQRLYKVTYGLDTGDDIAKVTLDPFTWDLKKIYGLVANKLPLFYEFENDQAAIIAQ